MTTEAPDGGLRALKTYTLDLEDGVLWDAQGNAVDDRTGEVQVYLKTDVEDALVRAVPPDSALDHELADQPPLLNTPAKLLARVRSFIEYARYVLEPGKASGFDQFPKQGDADEAVQRLNMALATLAAAFPRPAPAWTPIGAWQKVQGEDVLLYVDGIQAIAYWGGNDEDDWRCAFPRQIKRPSHVRPLQAAPGEGQ